MKKGGLYRHFCQFWLEKNNLRQPTEEAHVMGLLAARAGFFDATALLTACCFFDPEGIQVSH